MAIDSKLNFLFDKLNKKQVEMMQEPMEELQLPSQTMWVK
jgi:hypothetical protein